MRKRHGSTSVTRVGWPINPGIHYATPHGSLLYSHLYVLPERNRMSVQIMFRRTNAAKISQYICHSRALKVPLSTPASRSIHVAQWGSEFGVDARWCGHVLPHVHQRQRVASVPLRLSTSTHSRKKSATATANSVMLCEKCHYSKILRTSIPVAFLLQSWTRDRLFHVCLLCRTDCDIVNCWSCGQLGEGRSCQQERGSIFSTIWEF